MPMLAMRFAFEGGSSQDPAGKEGLANFVTAMLDEGAGDLEFARVPGAHGGPLHAHELRGGEGRLLRQLRDAHREPRRGGEATEAGAHKAALRSGRGGAHPPAAPGVARLRGARPRQGGAEPVVRRRLCRSSLCAPRQRHRGDHRQDHRRRPRELSQARVRQGHAEGRRGRRHHPRAARQAARRGVRRPAGQGRADAGVEDQPRLRRKPDRRRHERAAVGRRVRHGRHAAQGPGFHAGVRPEPDPRRRRLRLQADGGGAREARPRLLGLHLRLPLPARLDLLGRRRHAQRHDGPVARHHPRRAEEDGGRRRQAG